MKQILSGDEEIAQKISYLTPQDLIILIQTGKKKALSIIFSKENIAIIGTKDAQKMVVDLLEGEFIDHKLENKIKKVFIIGNTEKIAVKRSLKDNGKKESGRQMFKRISDQKHYGERYAPYAKNILSNPRYRLIDANAKKIMPKENQLNIIFEKKENQKKENLDIDLVIGCTGHESKPEKIIKGNINFIPVKAQTQTLNSLITKTTEEFLPIFVTGEAAMQYLRDK